MKGTTPCNSVVISVLMTSNMLNITEAKITKGTAVSNCNQFGTLILNSKGSLMLLCECKE